MLSSNLSQKKDPEHCSVGAKMEDMLDGREDGSNEKEATVTKANDFTMSTILLISGHV